MPCSCASSHRRADLLEDVDRPSRAAAALFGQHVAERAAVEVLHHEVGDAARRPRCAKPKSVTLTTFGWRRRPAARASRLKRSTNSSLRMNCGAMTLSATGARCRGAWRGRPRPCRPARAALDPVLPVEHLSDVRLKPLHRAAILPHLPRACLPSSRPSRIRCGKPSRRTARLAAGRGRHLSNPLAETGVVFIIPGRQNLTAHLKGQDSSPGYKDEDKARQTSEGGYTARRALRVFARGSACSTPRLHEI